MYFFHVFFCKDFHFSICCEIAGFLSNNMRQIIILVNHRTIYVYCSMAAFGRPGARSATPSYILCVYIYRLLWSSGFLPMKFPQFSSFLGFVKVFCFWKIRKCIFSMFFFPRTSIFLFVTKLREIYNFFVAIWPPKRRP